MRQHQVMRLSDFRHPKYWVTWIGLALLRLTLKLPDAPRRRVGRWLGRFFLARNRKRWQIAKTNIEWCFPELSTAAQQQLTTDYFASLGQAFCEFALIWWGDVERFSQAVEIEGGEWIAARLAAGQPVMLLTGHLLALDIAGVALSRHYPLLTYANQLRNPIIDALLLKGRSRFSAKLLQRQTGVRALLRTLKQGRLLYYVIDEDLGTRQSHFAPFFGVAKATLEAPARMAQLSGAVVAGCAAWFDVSRGRYRIVINAPLAGFPHGDAVVDAAQVNQLLEAAIRRAPAQYLWSQRLFHSRPDGAPPPYLMKGREGSGPSPRPEDYSLVNSG
ncbi:MAG: lysophospholipid acyltransferase family protein [Gammaproteobacteria bacterium]|nr:lysophospholipid acyltransferase family protein [Gammaproteobacteria bacterium]